MTSRAALHSPEEGTWRIMTLFKCFRTINNRSSATASGQTRGEQALNLKAVHPQHRGATLTGDQSLQSNAWQKASKIAHWRRSVLTAYFVLPNALTAELAGTKYTRPNILPTLELTAVACFANNREAGSAAEFTALEPGFFTGNHTRP